MKQELEKLPTVEEYVEPEDIKEIIDESYRFCHTYIEGTEMDFPINNRRWWAYVQLINGRRRVVGIAERVSVDPEKYMMRAETIYPQHYTSTKTQYNKTLLLIT